MASCIGVFVQNTIREWAARVAAVSSLGPMSHPTRHPVAAKDSDDQRPVTRASGASENDEEERHEQKGAGDRCDV